jgi:predicted tellurium resistance membrane protein TerC
MWPGRAPRATSPRMDWITDPHAWLGFATLTGLEIVLGIDNVVFISILAGKLPPEQRPRARRLGLALAMISRILLLISLSWVVGLTRPLFSIADFGFSGRDLVLLGGGLFLIAKSVREIHEKLEGAEGEASARVAPTFGAVLVQIMVLDVVFSLDSVITAVGMVDDVPIMVAAVIAAVAVMMVFADAVSRFVDEHPTLKMLALSFLLTIGVMLVAEGMHQHLPKGYVYFAMAYSIGVEMLNLRLRRRREKPVHLRTPYVEGGTPGPDPA